MSGRALRAAFPATIPVMTGFLCLGTAYGLLMQSKGYGPGWSVLMSAIAFGGSMQFVAVTLLTTAFDPVQAFLLSVMVNARHMFYGLSLLDKYKGLGKVRAFLIYVLCDETFSLVSTLEPPEGVARRDFYFWISLLDYLYWQGEDRKTLKRINLLIKDIERDPFDGIGKAEPLKHNLSGYWSRRIDDTNRLVYKVEDGQLYIISCRYHYE